MLGDCDSVMNQAHVNDEMALLELHIVLFFYRAGWNLGFLAAKAEPFKTYVAHSSDSYSL